MSDLRDDRTGYSIDNDPPDLRDIGVATVLYIHREGALDCYDHLAEPDHRVWCCGCGEHEILMPWRDHVAHAIEEWMAPRLADAWDEGDDHGYGAGHDGVGSGLNPYSDHLCSCGHPAKRAHLVDGTCRLCSCGGLADHA